MDAVTSLSELLENRNTSSYMEIPGTRAQTFGQTTLSTTLPISKLFSMYEVDLEVQRSINPRNLSQLMDYIMLYLDGQQAIYFPGIILSARGVGEYDEENEVFRLQPMDKLYVIDGQHRLAAFQRLMETLQSSLVRVRDQMEVERVEEITEKLRKLYAFPVSVMIYLDINAHQERQLFSDINKLPRKIGGNLAVLRDQRRFYHVLATHLIEQDPVLSRMEIDMFSERGKGEGFQFSYHFMIELLAALFEGRMKTTARNNGYRFTEKELRDHAEQASFYFDRLVRYLPEPSGDPICWSEEVQIALALFLHEEGIRSGTFNRYSLEHAMKILPHLPWRDIYRTEEEKSLPRRASILHAYEFVKQFYKDNHVFLIRDKGVQ